jgi:hypothetical protein
MVKQLSLLLVFFVTIFVFILQASSNSSRYENSVEDIEKGYLDVIEASSNRFHEQVVIQL